MKYNGTRSNIPLHELKEVLELIPNVNISSIKVGKDISHSYLKSYSFVINTKIYDEDDNPFAGEDWEPYRMAELDATMANGVSFKTYRDKHHNIAIIKVALKKKSPSDER